MRNLDFLCNKFLCYAGYIKAARTRASLYLGHFHTFSDRQLIIAVCERDVDNLRINLNLLLLVVKLVCILAHLCVRCLPMIFFLLYSGEFILRQLVQRLFDPMVIN